MDWITNPLSGEEVTNIEWIIAVFPGNKKNDGMPDPGISSWAQLVKALRDLLKKSFILKSPLVFCPYHCPYGVKNISGSSNIQRGWKDYQEVFHNI